MPMPRMPIGLIAFLLSATGAAITSSSAPAQGQAPSTTTPTDTPPIRKPGKMDVRHPLHIGSDYYPKESLRHHEQGRCTLAFFTEADGSVPAAQLLKSTGFPRLDTACFESVIGVPVIPATINGTPVAGWSDFNLVWIIDHAQPYQPLPERSAFPRMADDYEFQVGEKFYPEAERVRHPSGYCVVRTTVGSSGTALSARITHSTGSAILDKACLTAVTAARFTPELEEGKPVADSTDIAIYW
jgi:TonB family protein